MEIYPNTDIWLLSHVTLDSRQENTVLFASREAQVEAFSAFVDFQLSNYSYQREGKNSVKVKLPVDSLWNVNYMMFRNTAYGNKWFYAFVDKMEYLNNEVTRLDYTIDVMQTWLFECSPGTCFVEREHTSSDGLFEHTVKEDIGYGDEYVCSGQDTFDMNDMKVCVLLNKKIAGQADVSSASPNGIYTPMRIIAGLDSDDHASIDAALANFDEGDIVAVYQYPGFIPSDQDKASVQKTVSFSEQDILGGYVPKNKKLYCYPYNMLVVSNNLGETAEYRWEDWDSAHKGGFIVVASYLTTASALLYPIYYRGIINAFDDGIKYDKFPVCAWAGDSFKAWWAQHSSGSFWNPINTSVMSGLGSMAGSAMMGMAMMNPALGAAIMIGGGLTSVVNVQNAISTSLAKKDDAKAMPSQTYGQKQLESLNAALLRIRFTFLKMHAKPEYLRMCDDYFTRYGYACKRMKIPNRDVRRHFTYTKTVGCVLHGHLPNEARTKICAIYDAGITFWKRLDEVGQFALDNPPGS